MASTVPDVVGDRQFGGRTGLADLHAAHRLHGVPVADGMERAVTAMGVELVQLTERRRLVAHRTRLNGGVGAGGELEGDQRRVLTALVVPAYNTIINVNVPDVPINEILGIKSTRLGSRHKSAPSIQDSKDPSLYWIGENGKEADNGKGTDFHAISNNYVSVTPLQIDQTKYAEVNQLSNWLEDINY